MDLHRRFGYEEGAGNIVITETLANQIQYLVLARRKAARSRDGSRSTPDIESELPAEVKVVGTP